MDERITGLMVYYYFVCKRKLWYFCHGIAMENENENVSLGKLLDESSYSKEKHVAINDTINIDFIKERRELHEVKKSRSIEEASIWQVRYYIYYLQKRGVHGITGKIDYPLLKKTRSVELCEEDTRRLEAILQEIIRIRMQELPPAAANSKICNKCAYHDLCMI